MLVVFLVRYKMHVTSRKGRVSRNFHFCILVYIRVKVTSRKGRVSRN